MNIVFLAEESSAFTSTLIEYIFYGAVFIIGLIVLIFMSRRSKKSVPDVIVAQAQKAIKRIDALLEEEKEDKRNDYAVPAKLMQLKNEVGEMVVLADKEVNINRNISFEGVLGDLQKAASRLDDAGASWNKELVTQTLTDVRNDLENALTIIKEMSDKRKK